MITKNDKENDNNSTIRALPPLPPAPPPGAHPDSGPLLPIPPEIRPTLVKYRWDLMRVVLSDKTTLWQV